MGQQRWTRRSYDASAWLSSKLRRFRPWSRSLCVSFGKHSLLDSCCWLVGGASGPPMGPPPVLDMPHDEMHSMVSRSSPGKPYKAKIKSSHLALCLQDRWGWLLIRLTQVAQATTALLILTIRLSIMIDLIHPTRRCTAQTARPKLE